MAQTKAVFELLRTCDNAKYFGILMSSNLCVHLQPAFSSRALLKR
jgi:hypothetical protein